MSTKRERDSGDHTGFDPLALIEDSIKKGFDSSIVQEIDERQLSWCPNIRAWVQDADYLDIKTIFPHQLQVMLRLFGDVCPYCSDWEFYQKDWHPEEEMGNILDRCQFLEFGRCPKCNRTRLDAFQDNKWLFPNEINLLWGMRSGKSAVSGMIASYVLHRFLKIPDPASYFSLLKGSLLVMRFVALTAGQANESIWHQFTRSVETCTWFSMYHDFLKHYEKKHGVELNKWLTQSFGYTHKKLTGYYLGASIDTSRGRTAMFTAFDEIGWWLGNDQAKRANAHETYTAYEKSAQTIRLASATKFASGAYDVPTAWISAVSSTSSKTDYIMRLIRQARKDQKKVASHKASWEINPEFTRNPEELKMIRDRNPKTFLRDFGSVPPYSTDPFFEEDQALKMIKEDMPTPEWNVVQVSGEHGLYLDATGLEPDSSNTPYVLALDLGKNFSGYGAALLRLRDSDFSVVQIAGLFSIYPLQKNPIDLHMTFEKFVKIMCSKFNIGLVLFDQWQSTTQIDALKNMKIKAESYSMVYQDFDYFRSQVFQGKLEVPQPEIPFNEVEKSGDDVLEVIYPRPYVHFLWQLLSVCEVGRKLTKGDGHDDLFRAVSLGASYLWDEEYRPDFEYRAGMMRRRNTGGRLAMAGGSRSGHLYSTGGVAVGGGTVATSQKSKRTLGTITPRGR